jgi:hypothetical protein
LIACRHKKTFYLTSLRCCHSRYSSSFPRLLYIGRWTDSPYASPQSCCYFEKNRSCFHRLLCTSTINFCECTNIYFALKRTIVCYQLAVTGTYCKQSMPSEVPSLYGTQHHLVVRYFATRCWSLQSFGVLGIRNTDVIHDHTLYKGLSSCGIH